MNKDAVVSLDFIYENDVCVELGVWEGELSAQILKKPIKKLYLVDPWKSITDVPERWHAAPQKEMDKIYDGVVSKFSDDKRVEIIRDFSAQAAEQFEDNSVDWVYIDGNHSYEFVKEDLNLWWPKVKKGGVLCGDDFNEAVYQVKVLKFGVVEAVNEFVNEKIDEIKNFETIKYQFFIKK